MEREKITMKEIKRAYEIAKEFYQKKITKEVAINQLSKDMNKNSAKDYINNYSNFIEGKIYKRTTNIEATEYYLQKILEENGQKGLQNALLSLGQHLDYYEEKSDTTVIKRRKIYNEYLKKLTQKPNPVIYADEVEDEKQYFEGNPKKVYVNIYERNQIARQICIEKYGVQCTVCNFDFEKVYGEIGKDYIHVHHIKEISTIGKDYSIDPKKDLIPVCPNCHSMLHKKKPAFSVEELKKIISKN